MYIEFLAVLFSFISVILTIKENKWCWPVGIVGIIFYGILFLDQNLIGNFILQFIFLGQSFLGIWNWNKPKEEIQPRWLNKTGLLINVTLLSYYIFLVFSKIYGGSLEYIDTLTTVLSIIAMFLLSFKKTEGWIYWILVDIIYIFLFYISGLYLSSIIYFIFSILATIGLIRWSKNMKIA